MRVAWSMATAVQFKGGAMAQPMKKRDHLKFAFWVPALARIEYRGPDKEQASEALSQALARGEAIFYIKDIREIQWDLKRPNEWGAEVQWKCPSCGYDRNWFDLRRRNCFSHCAECGKKLVIVEGYAYWHAKGCASCPRRMECLLVERLHPDQTKDK
jgi:hypothetical protein